MQLSDISGIGPKRIALLQELGIYTADDLLRYYPKEYLDFSDVTAVKDAEEGETVTLKVTARSNPSVFFSRGMYIVSVQAFDETGKLTLRWMNQPYRSTQVKQGAVLLVHGRVTKQRGTVLYNPQILKQTEGIVPIYALSKGLTQPVFRAAIAQALKDTAISDTLPLSLRAKYALLPLDCALAALHQPTDTASLMEAKRRVAFEEALLYFLAVSEFRENHRRLVGVAFQTAGIRARFLRRIPFVPTEAQVRVMDEVERDMASAVPMNRLVQGDVGSGKTLIALYALTIAAACQKQGALLAPTEILAQQHYETIRALFGDACALYVGSMRAAEKAAVQKRLQDGTVSVVIGTHALLSEQVRFCDLALIVTDEQHRFGVAQRAKLEEKGARPDVLVMSATPIPRTLALLLYADLDLSVIDMLPKGRKPIETRFVPHEKRIAMYRHLATRAKVGERTYVVCPLIEPTEGFEGLSVAEIAKELSTLLPDCTVDVLHGRMHDEQKQAAMERFRAGKTEFLVATTVVEVGVDVKAATAMVIEGAEHFGLATLHQLRGRVGRGDVQSYCYLLSDNMTKVAKARIGALLGSTDGFVLAQKDMETRGYGDLFGVRQSGDADTQNILSGCSVELLTAASAAAAEVQSVPNVENNALLQMAVTRYISLSHIARN